MSDPALMAATLDYAPRPSIRRRWLGRLRRWWPAGLLLVIAIVCTVYGPKAWRQRQLLRLQGACLTAELRRDLPVNERHPEAAWVLVAARPAEYQLDSWGRAARTDPRWTRLSTELGLPPYVTGRRGWPTGLSFLGERYTPSGLRRLVVIEDMELVTVIDPATWTHAARVTFRRQADCSLDDWSAMAFAGLGAIGVGVADQADRTRVTVPVDGDGGAAVLEFRLDDNEIVTWRVLEPAGKFRAVARAATQPAGR
jgi:hypothetical protein